MTENTGFDGSGTHWVAHGRKSSLRPESPRTITTYPEKAVVQPRSQQLLENAVFEWYHPGRLPVGRESPTGSWNAILIVSFEAMFSLSQLLMNHRESKQRKAFLAHNQFEQAGQQVRMSFLRIFSPSDGKCQLILGDTVILEGSLHFERSGAQIRIGSRTFIGSATKIIAANEVVIGDDVLISWGSPLWIMILMRSTSPGVHRMLPNGTRVAKTGRTYRLPR